jgi:hypothetical protein
MLVATQTWAAASPVILVSGDAFAWLFYAGLVLLIGGMGAFLATLISFGGIERNGAAQIALSAYLFIVGAAFLLAPAIWGALGQGEADQGISLLGMALEIIPVLLVAGYQLLPIGVRSPWPPLPTLAISAALVIGISLGYVIVGFSVAFLFLSGLPALAPALGALPLLVPALMIGAVLAVDPERGQDALAHLRAAWPTVLCGAALVVVALLLRGPTDWSQPPLWGSDLLLLSLLAGVGVFAYTRRFPAAPDQPTRSLPEAISRLRSWGVGAARLPIRGHAAGLVRRVGRVGRAAASAAGRARARRPSIPAWLRRAASGVRR